MKSVVIEIPADDLIEYIGFLDAALDKMKNNAMSPNHLIRISKISEFQNILYESLTHLPIDNLQEAVKEAKKRL